MPKVAQMEKAVEIRELNFTYPDGKPALNNINLDIFNGETIGIIGPNGAGKTTLLLHLNCILKGTGMIKIFGIEANGSKNLKEIRKKVGLVFQNPDDQLFSQTVFDDVAFGPINMGFDKESVITRVKESLNYVNIFGFEEKHPYHLSVGEKKKISIATILSMEPEIFVLDEPTGELDPRSKKNIINILKNIKSTKIIATHDLELVLEICNRVFLLDNGSIVSFGETKSILNNVEILEPHGLEVPLSIRLKR